MRHLKQLRPSPALVISVIALFVSLGGVSWGVATGFIDSREIKNNTVRTRDLRNNDVRSTDIRNNTIAGRDIRTNTVTGSDVRTNSLTGRDVLESSLGTVPSAGTAGSAGSAGRANSAGSVDRLAISGQARANEGGADVEVLRGAGFRVVLRCSAANGAQLFAINDGAGQDSHANSWDPTTTTNTDFDQGAEFLLTGTATTADGTRQTGFDFQGSNGATLHGQGVVSYKPDGAFAGSDCVGSAFAAG